MAQSKSGTRMCWPILRSWLAAALPMIGILVASTSATLIVPDTLGTHDPSRVIEDNGAFYFYSTSDGVSGYYTTNGGSTWKGTGSIFPNGIPADVHAASPKNDGRSIWAPDVVFNNNTNLFYVYYAVADWNDATQTAIGLVTSPTLNPSKAVWTSRGVVIARTKTDNEYQAIDPCPFFDFDGNMWLTLGSGYAATRATAINVVALDKMTGLRSDNTVHALQGCGCEASYMKPHNGYYYLFWNTGGCCSGAKSTYTIHVARSTSVTGPFNNSQIFLAPTSTQHGPGQIGFTNDTGVDYYSYHYAMNNGNTVLGYRKVDWSSSGWPLAS